MRSLPEGTDVACEVVLQKEGVDGGHDKGAFGKVTADFEETVHG